MARLRRLLRRPAGRDGGWSLLEVVVFRSIMSIFLVMMTAGVVEVYRVVDGADAVAVAQSQVNIAFLKLDREIRYASDISTPGQVTGTTYRDWYVEYVTGAASTSTCHELRLRAPVSAPATGWLEQQAWQGSSPSGRWTRLASGITATQPFTLVAAGGARTFPQLALNLTASSGTGPTAATKSFRVTFTALNAKTTTSAICHEGRGP
jgi:hypothetical protein